MLPGHSHYHVGSLQQMIMDMTRGGKWELLWEYHLQHLEHTILLTRLLTRCLLKKIPHCNIRHNPPMLRWVLLFIFTTYSVDCRVTPLPFRFSQRRVNIERNKTAEGGYLFFLNSTISDEVSKRMQILGAQVRNCETYFFVR